ncbi:OmpH family outer membrane protein [Aggregatibacter aphrophilus]|uniref:OmpH family outer membrane protein n=1 Tax=Aggregatibacter aphrophilus TaxID=732 RepID=UPI000DA325FC|nr:OmpH family outer membrane protein [Aggregatibacter aphrophilus]RDE89617.1 OmpH family outer membrane protein [Aggregatibacter aphrophilus]SQI96720.1 p28 [Aggregatibacter aphrophilus]
MKKVVKLTALSLALVFTSSLAMAEENIAFVSAEYLFQNHPDRKAIADKLESEFKPTADKLAENKKQIDAKIADVQKKVDAKVAALQKDAPKLRSADIKKREDEINKFANDEQTAINKLIAEHDKKAKEFQDSYAKRENEETSKMVASIQTATNNVAKQKNYTLVLDDRSVVYAADGKNITKEVLKAIPAQAK